MGLDNDQEGARDLILGEQRQLQRQYLEALDEMIAYQRRMTSETAESSAKDVMAASAALLILSLLSAVLGLRWPGLSRAVSRGSLAASRLMPCRLHSKWLRAIWL